MKKIYTIGYFIFWAIVICVAVVVLASVLPIPGKLEIKIVQSGSMEPTIKVGSIVVIKPEGAYKVGDIITFGKDTKKEIPTTHRIVASKVESGVMIYTTKGDANEDKDTKEVKQSEIIGRVIFSVPYLGYIIDFAKKPIGFAIFIGLPALYIAYDEVVKIVKEVKKIKNKKDNAGENI
jgi:signal peptidase I